MHSVTLTEPTTLLRDWARATSTVTSLVGQRTYAGGVPKGAGYPALVVTRIGGGLDGPLDVGTYRFDCWAVTAPGAAQLAGVVASWLASQGPQPLSGGPVRFCGANVTSAFPVPDPDDPSIYRFTLTAQVVTTTAPA